MSKPDNPAEPFRKALAEATRALAGDEVDLSVKYSADPPGLSETAEGPTVRLPIVSHRMGADEVRLARGHGDAYAMRARHHDEGIHTRYTPEGDVARRLFDAMEDARVEALGGRDMPGVGDNLDVLLEHEARAKGWRASDSADIVDAARLLVRGAGSGRDLPDDAEAALSRWRSQLEEKCGDALEDLDDCLGDQQAFAKLAWRIIDDVGYGDQLGQSPDEADQEDEAEDDDSSDQDMPDEEDGDDDASGESQDGSGDGEDDEQSAEQQTADQDSDPAYAKMAVEGGEDGAEPEEGDEEFETPEAAHRHDPAPMSDADPNYRVFSRASDEMISPDEICEPEELERLRAILDQQIAPFEGAASRLANRLQRRLLAQQNRAWEFDREEGILDAGRLARVVANPTTPLSFKVERDTDFRDTVVTLLLDNSGSMRGRPISIAAISADILARTLERCHVKVEILGFTTRQWKGGDARKAWVDAERPANPGRLNDLRHIIYKGADAPWRRARRNLGLMMREGLLKENIDGEALEWAHRRLIGRPEQRRILMVISDGAPVDDSTLSANPTSYLERHLRDVISMIEKKGAVELTAIGIGHDVTRYYDRAVKITDAEQLAGAMTEQLAALFDMQDARKARKRGRAA
ncbi:MAG: cobaltochelatase subunit CobT [Pseudomonadota bacterium]